MMRESGRRVGGWAGSVALAMIVACDGASRLPANPPGSRDSAGITIIESSAPKFGAGQGRRVAATPTLDIAGPPGGDFGDAIAAVRLSDGRLVVADGQPSVLRYFSADGRWLYDVGSASDGKNSLRSIFDLSVGRADTVAVYDLAMRQVRLIDPNGAYAGTTTVDQSLVPAGSNGFLPHGITPDGRYLLQRDEVDVPYAGKAGEVRPDSTTLFWLDRAGKLSDSSARVQAGQIFGFAVQTGKAEPFIAPLSRPFGGVLRVASGASLVWYGESHTWELRGLDGHGRVAQIVRLSRPAVPLTAALRDTFVARYQAQRGGAGAGMVQRQFVQGIATAPFADTLPAFNAILIGRDSTFWLQHSGLLDGMPGDASLDWTLIGADGTWSQEITMPAGFRPTAAGKDWVLGLWRDARGAARVRLYSLVEG